MQNAINSLIATIGSLIAWLWGLVHVVWSYTFGHVVHMWTIQAENLSLSKQVIFFLALCGIVTLFVITLKAWWEAVVSFASFLIALYDSLKEQWLLAGIATAMSIGGALLVIHGNF